ncbi:PKD domain-containing protein [Kitasatospora sp. NPDC127111]|uniref:PKD domain-containing protein n=1 Tax=Kitasatospora sp. NPDC127111 TaxID=3345363 RepID=UPI0036395192
MSVRRHVGLAVAVAGSAVGGIVLPTAAHAGSAVLYVDNDRSANCSDAGTGTKEQPYCTIQAAADVAEPGQTVQVASARTFTGQVTVKRSGLPGKPIVFKADFPYLIPTTSVGTRDASEGPNPAPHAFLLAGVHDVTVTGFNIGALQEGVLVQDSERIVLDHNDVQGGNPPASVSAFPGPVPSVRITGRSTGVTVSRNRITPAGTAGVSVEAGASGTVLTTNQITDGGGRGIVVTDAPGTVVVSNTFARNCLSDVELAGNSSGAVVENNLLAKRPTGWCGGAAVSAAPLSVSADSTQGTKADYNTVLPNAAAYSWGGASYRTPAEFRATGQGAHDNSADPQFSPFASSYTPVAVEGLTDAADATAPGVLDTDVYGKPRADHPRIANTGTGNGYHDRGAVELNDTMSVYLESLPYSTSGHPLNARINVHYQGGWAPAGATLDFGDGSAPVPVAAGFPSFDHDYPAGGTYRLTLTATSETGLVRTSTSTVTLAPLAELAARIGVGQGDRRLAQVTVSDRSSSPWPVARYSFDFGDGTPAVVSEGPTPPNGLTHEYGVTGTYTITETVVDDHGRTASTSVRQYVPGPQPGVPFAGYFGGPTSHAGLFDRGHWALSYQKSDSQAASTWAFGDPGDLPVVGAWDNTCQCQSGVYRPSTGTFALRHQDGSVSTVGFGDQGDLPAVGAWDRNGHDQLAIFRPSTGTLAVRHDDGSVTTMRFGDPGDLPVVGDWDGVHHAQFGLFRPGRNEGDPNLFVLRHDDGSVSTAAYGVKGDLPVVGDWLGRGRTTFGIFRPGGHVFALSNAYAGQADSVFTIYG